MGANDFRNVLLFYPAIPDSIGIDDHDRSVLAQAEATAGSHLNLMVQPLGIKFSLQSLQNLQRAVIGARRDSFGLSLCADEYMLMKRLHVRSPLTPAGRRAHSSSVGCTTRGRNPPIHSWLQFEPKLKIPALTIGVRERRETGKLFRHWSYTGQHRNGVWYCVTFPGHWLIGKPPPPRSKP